MNIVLFLLIGLAAGYLAGRIMKGRDFGLAGNLIVGCVGALIGGYLFSLVGIHATGLVGSLITALAGAVLFLYLLRFVRERM